MSLLLHGGVDGAGEPLKLRADSVSGTFLDASVQLEATGEDELLDCTGMVLLPAPAEPHAHLDKALSAGRVDNPGGDLAGAVEAWRVHRPTLTEGDVLARARTAAHELIAHGATAIRSHVDVGPGIGLKGVHALVALREELHREGLADLQLVALASVPLSGAEGAINRAWLDEAMEAGCDVVGGCPHLDPDPPGASAGAFDLAVRLGRPIDLHTDETLNPAARGLCDLVGSVAASDFSHGAVASHCVSLGVQDPERQALIARAVAAAGVAIVTLPQTNLYLQARGLGTSPPRGLTAVRALLDAGACVAAGADNVRDPFNCVGRSDPLETAALLVMAAHLTPAEAWEAVSAGARKAMGLPPGRLEAGQPAEILAVRGTDLADAVARASEHRIVVHAGRCVSHTQVTGALQPLPSTPVLT